MLIVNYKTKCEYELSLTNFILKVAVISAL